MRKLNMPRRLSSSAARTHGGNMLFMLPTIILFCIVVLIPFFQGIPYSFTNWKSIVSETKEFNGLKNYIYLIKNKYFQDSLLVTFKFTILYMISANVMGLLLALAIHRSSWFNNIARTVLFLPFTVSATAGSIVWSYVFTDGNGRMSRLLSLLLLYKNGFDAGKYVSFEEQISNYKAYYYEALRQSSVGWEAGENSYFPFVENFLSTLYMCYKELDKRFAVVHGKKVTKKARVEATVLNNLTPISKAEICKILPDVSPTTVEAVLGAMVKTGSVKRIGAGRAARYIKA